jgi:diadenosine tetraphosphatase ApaH/serine/threonine PP2A family protein phosphatase
MNVGTSLNTLLSNANVRRLAISAPCRHSQAPPLGLHKYSENVYEACLRSFCSLPIAALVDGKFFCVHGGLSPQLITLNDLASVRLFRFLRGVR